jgi:hypothetical protein
MVIVITAKGQAQLKIAPAPKSIPKSISKSIPNSSG